MLRSEIAAVSVSLRVKSCKVAVILHFPLIILITLMFYLFQTLMAVIYLESYLLLVTMPARHARAISWFAHNWNATKHRALSR